MKIAYWSVLALAALMLLPAQPVDRNKPFPAHKVVGNIYFVGTADLGTYLVTTPEGHILINTDYESTVPQIRKGVTDLGFKFTDIKIILGSHAHGDHMEGDAMVKELTAARVMAMEQDLPALKRITPGGKPHPIDRVLHDGDEVKLGGATLQAHLTPGHTQGCTTWSMKATEAGKTYDVVIVCSVGWNPGYILVNNKDTHRSVMTTCEASQPCASFRATSSSPPTADSTTSPASTRNSGREELIRSSIILVTSHTLP